MKALKGNSKLRICKQTTIVLMMPNATVTVKTDTKSAYLFTLYLLLLY